MEGILQGAVFMLLCLATAFVAKEPLESIQSFDPSGGVQQSADTSTFIDRRQSLSPRSNPARRLYRYRKEEITPDNAGNYAESVETLKHRDLNSWQRTLSNVAARRLGSSGSSGQDSSVPIDGRQVQRGRQNFIVGLSRRMHSFMPQEQTLQHHDQQIDPEDHEGRQEQGYPTGRQEPSDTLNAEDKGEFSEERGQEVMSEAHVRWNQNINHYSTDLGLEAGDNETNRDTPIIVSSQENSRNPYNRANDHLSLSGDGKPLKEHKGNIHAVESLDNTASNDQFRNAEDSWQDRGLSGQNFHSFERLKEDSGILVRDHINPYSRVRVPSRPNRGRRRFRDRNMRRFLRMRRPGTIPMNIRARLQRKNFEFRNNGSLNSNTYVLSQNRNVDQSSVLTTNEDGQKILTLQENSGSLRFTENERNNSGNSYLPNFQPNASGLSGRHNLNTQNEGQVNIYIKSQNENFEEADFNRYQNNQSFRFRLRSPKMFTNTESNISQENRKFSNDRNAHQVPIYDNGRNEQTIDKVDQSSSKPKIIPIQLTRNQPQYPDVKENSNPHSDETIRKHYSSSHNEQQHLDQSLLSTRQDLEEYKHNRTHLQNIKINEDFINDQRSTLVQQFHRQQQEQQQQQPLNSQISNNERLSQFQHQIENQRLLQYPQQHTLDQAVTDPSPKRSKQLHLILNEQRLLQYRQQQANAQSLTQINLDSSHQDSQQIEETGSEEDDDTLPNTHSQVGDGLPSQENQHHNSQHLVGQYYKPAQVHSDAFVSGRPFINDPNRRTDEELLGVNPPADLSYGSDSKNDSHSYLPKSGLIIVNRFQGMGRFANAAENRDFNRGHTISSTYDDDQTEERNEDTLIFDQQQITQSQDNREITDLSFSHTGSDKHQQRLLSATLRNSEDTRPTLSRTSGRLNPLPGGQSLIKNSYNIQSRTGTQVTQKTNPSYDYSQRANNVRGLQHHHAPKTQVSTSLSFGDLGQYHTSAVDSLSPGDVNTQTRNRHFNTYDGQNEHVNINANLGRSTVETKNLDNVFSQGNGYLPHHKVVQNQNERVSTSRDQAVVNSSGQKSEISDNRAIWAANNGQTLVRNDQASIHRQTGTYNFQQNHEIPLLEVSNERPDQQSEILEYQPYIKEEDTIREQIPNRKTALTALTQDQPSSLSNKERFGFRNNPLSFSKQHLALNPSHINSDIPNTKTDVVQNQFSDTERQSRVIHPLIDKNTESQKFQYHQTSLKQGDGDSPIQYGALNFQSSSDRGYSNGNIQTFQPNLQQNSFQQRQSSSVGVYSSSGQSGFQSRQNSENREYPLEHKFSIRGDKNMEQTTLSGHQPKVTNAHGQPGFTYERKLISYDNFPGQRFQGEQISSQDGTSISANHPTILPDGQIESQSNTNARRIAQSNFDVSERFSRTGTTEEKQYVDEQTRQSSLSSHRGNLKFLDTFEGISRSLPNEEVIETIAAVLQGKYYFDQRIVSTKLQNISGVPRLTEIPETGFRCNGRLSGYYADAHHLAKCQSFHFCGVNGAKISYVCPAGTVFNQRLLVCDHVFRVECNASADFYYVNKRLYGANVHQPLRDVSRNHGSFGRRI